MNSKWKPYKEWDLCRAKLLPEGWDREIRALIASDGIRTLLSEGPESREGSGDYAIPVTVVTGEICTEKLPWLRHLYEHDLLRFSENWFGAPLHAATDLRSSININCLTGFGARYETHIDTNTVTGVLFVSECDSDSGGELVFCSPNGERSVIAPKAGIYVAFDARAIPHFVAPLKSNRDRISIPMNYYDHPTEQYRPPGLDDRLYTPTGA